MTTNMTLADAIRAGLGIDGEAAAEARRRVEKLLANSLLFYMDARNGGRAQLEGRNDSRLWDMRYVQVEIRVKRPFHPFLPKSDNPSLDVSAEFALCAFDDGGVGRKLSPLEALDHIRPQDLRDRIAAAFARMGDADGIKV